ncbi:hypothetical protein [Schaedlerella arabinosiphila]|nr:hypothetical protein [Schaedlerella arabinosiphila]
MLSFFLGALAFVCCYPIIFLLTGALRPGHGFRFSRRFDPMWN